MDIPALAAAEWECRRLDVGRLARQAGALVGKACETVFGVPAGDAYLLATPEYCGDRWPTVFDATWTKSPEEAVAMLKRIGWDARHKDGSPMETATLVVVPLTMAALGLAGVAPDIAPQARPEEWGAALAEEARRWR